jgi:type VI secretion system secreted protein Hcp
MAYEFYVTVEGKRTGRFHEEAAGGKGKAAGKVTGLAFDYSVDSPRDQATGMATGKRVHHPISFVKQWGASSPQFFLALVTNDVLSTVLFEFMSTSEVGKQQVFHTIKLTNAAVSAIEQFVAHDDQDARDARALEKISLTFQRIEITNLDANTTAMDDMFGPP